MSNPIYQMMQSQQPQSGFMNMLQQFKQFKDMFTGNPRDEVEKLLKSGDMSQQQFNQFAAEANKLQEMFK